MTTGSQARVEKRMNLKKKAAGTTAPHQTHSFAQLVSEAQLKSLQPWIAQQVNLLGQQLSSQMFQVIMREKAQMLTRQVALERILKANLNWFTEDAIATTVMDIEDESEGAKQIGPEDAIVDSDKVVVDFQTQASKEEAYGAVNKLSIFAVNTKGQAGTVQTHADLEAGLIGRKVGETFEFLIPEGALPDKEPENTRVKVTVTRVSRRPAPPAAPVAVEATTEAPPATEEATEEAVADQTASEAQGE